VIAKLSTCITGIDAAIIFFGASNGTNQRTFRLHLERSHAIALVISPDHL